MVDAYTASLVASQHRELLKELASLRADLMARLDQLEAAIAALASEVRGRE